MLETFFPFLISLFLHIQKTSLNGLQFSGNRKKVAKLLGDS